MIQHQQYYQGHCCACSSGICNHAGASYCAQHQQQAVGQQQSWSNQGGMGTFPVNEMNRLLKEILVALTVIQGRLPPKP